MPLRSARIRHWQVAILTAIGGYLVAFIAAAAIVYGPWFTITLTQLLVIAIFLAAYAASIVAALFGLSRVLARRRLPKPCDFGTARRPHVPRQRRLALYRA